MATSGKDLSKQKPVKFKGITHVRIGIAVAEWNSGITKNLKKGAVTYLGKCGVSKSNIIVQDCPGSFELPLTAQWLIEHKDVDAVVCLGSVIKGETDHFHYVCSAVSQGVKDVALKHSKPVIFGVLTDNTQQQAKDRSGGKHGNKGTEAAATALKMMAMINSMD